MLCKNSDHPYFFGTQNLNCVKGRTRRSIIPTRFVWDISHRLVYYRDAVYELHPGGVYTRTSPNWELANRCNVTWESTPAGTSTCSIEEMREFANNYVSNYGGYNLFTNNCHKFANRVSTFLFQSNCSHNEEPVQ